MSFSSYFLTCHHFQIYAVLGNCELKHIRPGAMATIHEHTLAMHACAHVFILMNISIPRLRTKTENFILRVIFWLISLLFWLLRAARNNTVHT